jgi:transposase
MNEDNLPQNIVNHQPMEDVPDDAQERTLTLLHKIQTGLMDPKCLRIEERHLIVCYLMADGYCTAEMAQIVGCSERTIERNKKAIRQANAIVSSPQLVEQMAGRLVSEAELCVQKIRKAARDNNTPSAVKIDAEYRCFQIINQMTISLQRLGYLPTAAARLQADITHNIGQVPELSQIELEYQRLKRISGECQSTDTQIKERFNLLEAKFKKVSFINELNEISNLINVKENKNESE